MRNPKDTSVSAYEFIRLITFTNYKGTFKEFMEDYADTMGKSISLYKPIHLKNSRTGGSKTIYRSFFSSHHHIKLLLLH